MNLLLIRPGKKNDYYKSELIQPEAHDLNENLGNLLFLNLQCNVVAKRPKEPSQIFKGWNHTKYNYTGMVCDNLI